MKSLLLFISLLAVVACSQNNNSGSGGGGNGGGTGQILQTADMKSMDYKPIKECTMQSMLKDFPQELARQVYWPMRNTEPGWNLGNVIVHLTDVTLMGKNDLAKAASDNFFWRYGANPVNVDESKTRLFFGLDVTLVTNKGDFKVVSWDLTADSPMPYLYVIDPAVYSTQKADGQPGELAYGCLSTILLNLPNPNWKPGQNLYRPVAGMVLVEKATGQQNALSLEMNQYLTAEGMSQPAMWISMARDFKP